MEIHYKITMWCKIILDENKISKEEVLQKLNEGYLPSEIGFNEDINSQWEVIEDAEEFITPSENDGQATIELMEYQDSKIGLQSVWDNSFESELKRKQNENRKYKNRNT